MCVFYVGDEDDSKRPFEPHTAVLLTLSQAKTPITNRSGAASTSTRTPIRQRGNFHIVLRRLPPIHSRNTGTPPQSPTRYTNHRTTTLPPLPIFLTHRAFRRSRAINRILRLQTHTNLTNYIPSAPPAIQNRLILPPTPRPRRVIREASNLPP